MFNATLNYEGLVSMKLVGPDGQVKQSFEQKHNLVTAAGLRHSLKRMLGDSTATLTSLNVTGGTENEAVDAPIGYVGIGQGSTAPSSNDTALQTPFSNSRVAFSNITLDSTGTSVVYKATFAPGVGTGPVQEAGLFTAETGGVMTNRVVFAVINKGEQDSLECQWRLNVVNN